MSFAEEQYTIDEVLKGIKKQFAANGVVPGRFLALSMSVGDSCTKIMFTPPSDIAVGGAVFAKIAGVEMWRREGAAIASYGEGTLVETFTGSELNAYTNTPYVDDGLTNDTEYYYCFFSYTENGTYNKDVLDQVHGTPGVYIYGLTQNFSDNNPDTSIGYPNDVLNSGYTPMHTNEGTGTATAGSWGSFLTDFLNNSPYMVGTDGRADYMLDPDDYTKKADGTASDYNNTSYAGGAFAWMSKFYTKEVYAADGNSRTVYFSNVQVDEDYYPLGFVDPNDAELEGVWIPMGYTDNSGRVLVAGTTPGASKTTADQKTLVDGFSSRAVFLGAPILNVIRDLFYMLYKSTNIQDKGGHGRCNAGSQAVIANAVVANGVVPGFKGTSNKTTLNKAFHSQVLFGYQVWLRDPYTILSGGVLKLSPHYKYDVTGATYETAANNANWNTSNSNWQYPSHLVHEGKEFGSVPKMENTASTSTGLTDGVLGTASSVRVGVRLGACDNDLIDGPAALTLNNEASYAHWAIGFATLLLPPAGYAPQAA